MGSGGGGGFGDDVAAGQDLAGMPSNVRQAILRYEFQVNNDFYGGNSGGESFEIEYGTMQMAVCEQTSPS
ncbi:MAG: hypothetical protein WKF84_24915 [Pyrinomonadaceae bacterium]